MKMKKLTLLLFALACAMTTWAKGIDTLAVDLIYKELLANPKVTKTPVRYTGRWKQGIRGFAWQQGEGRGWTVGTRLALRNAKKADFDRFAKVFKDYNQYTHVSIHDNRFDMGLERCKTFYGMHWDDGTLYFLKAKKLGNEFCVPIDWINLSYYNGGESHPDYWGSIDAPTRRLLGLSHLWSSVKRNFVFMNRASVNWDSLYVAMIPQIKATTTDGEAVRLLQRMAATLNDGHTFVYSYYPQDMRSMPFSTRWIDGKVYVDKVYSSAFAKQGVRRGQQLVSIDGEDVEAYAKREVMPYVSASTEQWRIHETYDGMNLTSRFATKPMTVQLRDGKKLLSVTYDFKDDDFDLYETQQPKLLTYDAMEHGIGYLKISNFMDGRLVQEFNGVYPEILKTRALIIDIRNNPGGNSTNGDYIAKHFFADTLLTGAWESRLYIPAYASWNYPEKIYRNEGTTWRHSERDTFQLYLKPVVLLVDRGTFSAAEDFISVMRATGHVTLVGEKTGGSTGNGVRVSIIPGVCEANICSKHDFAADGSDFVGYGFTPDIPVAETHNSYFNAKRDNALTKALQWLNKGKF